MKLHDIDINENLIIYVDDDGIIDSAMTYLPAFDEWIIVTDKVRKDEEKYRDKINEKLQDIRDNPPEADND